MTPATLRKRAGLYPDCRLGSAIARCALMHMGARRVWEARSYAWFTTRQTWFFVELPRSRGVPRKMIRPLNRWMQTNGYRLVALSARVEPNFQLVLLAPRIWPLAWLLDIVANINGSPAAIDAVHRRAAPVGAAP